MYELDQLQQFLAGMNRFYNKFNRRELKEKIIWQQGSTKILDYSPEDYNLETPCLIFIPSLINKSYILDLDSETSLIRYFAALGYRCYLIDFTEPLDDEVNFGFHEYVGRMIKAFSEIFYKERIVLFGFCFGGVLSAALVVLQKKLKIIGQVLIATPWSFSHLNKSFIDKHNLIMLCNLLDKFPPTFLQFYFSLLDQQKIWNKFLLFSQSKSDQEIKKFILIEQWVNDGISLSKKFALDAITMFFDESLVNKIFFTPHSNIPCLSINGLEDKICPPESSKDLLSCYSSCKQLYFNTGHVGLIISKTARTQIWPEIKNWLNQI